MREEGRRAPSCILIYQRKGAGRPAKLFADVHNPFQPAIARFSQTGLQTRRTFKGARDPSCQGKNQLDNLSLAVAVTLTHLVPSATHICLIASYMRLTGVKTGGIYSGSPEMLLVRLITTRVGRQSADQTSIRRTMLRTASFKEAAQRRHGRC